MAMPDSQGIHNVSDQVRIKYRVKILKTYYFRLEFLYKSELRILYCMKTYWNFQIRILLNLEELQYNPHY